MFKQLSFKGTVLERGDIVTIIAESCPVEFQAAVVDVDAKTDTLQVISTQLAIFQHSGMFPSGDVQAIEVIRGYADGLSTEARAQLNRGQHCVVSVKDGVVNAIVVAAFDGMVTGESIDTPGVEDGTSITGGSSFWQAA